VTDDVDLSVVILSWNTKALTLAAVRARTAEVTRDGTRRYQRRPFP
jgi:hypothetical protein